MTASTSSRSWSAPVCSGGDFMLHPPQPRDLDADGPAHSQELGRVLRYPDTRRRPGEDQVAGLQRARLAEERDDRRDPEDEVRGRRVLAQLAVDPGAQREPVRIVDLVGGGDPRAVGTGVVEALGARPLRLALLEVT